MPDDAERKGLGTPATRAGILEKLVSSGFVERKKNKKAVQPGSAGYRYLPDYGTSGTAPVSASDCGMGEYAEGDRARRALLGGVYGADQPHGFLNWCATTNPVSGAEILFPSGRPVVGKCPRCGGPVTESKTGFFCERRDCRFGLWKDNRYLSAKHIILTKKMAEALLKDGKTFVSGMYSEKTGKSYSAYLVLTDDGQKSSYALEFDREKTGA